MKKHFCSLFAVVCLFAVAAGVVVTAAAQTSEVKEKPRMFTYVSDWAIPRAQWGEMEKSTAADQKILDKAVSAGTIVGYGDDVNLVHRNNGDTHDDWWSAMSMAGVLNVLDQFYKSGSATAPVLSSATRHSDSIFVSRYYNWHSGTYKDAYTMAAVYKLKADAPDDAVEMLSKDLVAPLLEKTLADGTIVEYEIDTEAIHTDDPAFFAIVYVSPNSEGIDKVSAAIRESLKANPLGGPAFGSMVDFSAHRDYLDRTNAMFK